MSKLVLACLLLLSGIACVHAQQLPTEPFKPTPGINPTNKQLKKMVEDQKKGSNQPSGQDQAAADRPVENIPIQPPLRTLADADKAGLNPYKKPVETKIEEQKETFTINWTILLALLTIPLGVIGAIKMLKGKQS